MKSLATCLLLLLSLIGATSVQAAEPVLFARDVLPILSANCYACHGPDPHERQAELRLDLETDAKREHISGMPIVPGRPERSVVIKRLLSKDPDEIMPPPESRRQLKPEQIDTIRRWVIEGAQWQRHWSFEPVAKPPGTLDELVRAELAKKSLLLRDAAAPQTLVRRLSLDLIGLPPTPEEADRFAGDLSPAGISSGAYAKLVDDLLSKPQFGEHWARMWLDLARYADTKGYEKDLGRTMWPYRDWLVNALNADMPLDQFTIEQLAGDLLPNATDQQVIATAFHRNTMSNDEGGTDDEEFRVAAVKDRVDNTIQVWMGLTMGCAKCHTHKYDPISNDDYYRLYAIFNQTQDADRYDDSPRFEILTPAQRAGREALLAKVSQLEADLKATETAVATKPAADNKWTPLRVVDAKSSGEATLTPTPEQTVAVTGKTEVESVYKLTCTAGAGRHTALRLEALPAKFPSGLLGVGRNPDDPNFVVSELLFELLDGDTGRPIKLINPRADFSQEGWDVKGAIDGDEKTGWAVSPRSRERHVALFDLAEPLKLDAESKVRVTLTQKYGNRLTLALFRLSTSGADTTTLVPDEAPPEIRKLREDLSAARKAIETFNATVPQLP
ncbi:MAG TPA: DUF1549 domain-containing protein, partial [Planctomycetaceae bacterium]